MDGTPVPHTELALTIVGKHHEHQYDKIGIGSPSIVPTTQIISPDLRRHNGDYKTGQFSMK